MTAEKLVVYLDLNVYSRPFDDQTNEKIRRETEAINVLWDQAKKGLFHLVSSDILYLEVKRILSESGGVGILVHRIPSLLIAK